MIIDVPKGATFENLEHMDERCFQAQQCFFAGKIPQVFCRFFDENAEWSQLRYCYIWVYVAGFTCYVTYVTPSAPLLVG